MSTTEDLVDMCRQSFVFHISDCQRKLTDPDRPLPDSRREWLTILTRHAQDCLLRFDEVINSGQLTEYDDIWAWNEREQKGIVEMRTEYRRQQNANASSGSGTSGQLA